MPRERAAALTRKQIYSNPSGSRSANGVFIGLMSGTSADGIDAVVASLTFTRGRLRPRILAHVHQTFPGGLRRRILECALHGRVADICELNFQLGEEFATAAKKAIRRSGVSPSRIVAIGSHGQTMHHLPNGRWPSTLQIGEGAVIAERTGIVTVSDFRVRDMAAGGQGAPLVPLADWLLFSDPLKPRLVQNIGGIGNVTFLPPAADLAQVKAFDTGPGNMVIDGVVGALTNGRLGFDIDGKIAASGKVSEGLLNELWRHPFLAKTPPKTTGREEFGGVFVERVLKLGRKLRLSRRDIVCTVTDFTAATIAEAYNRWILPRLPGSKLKHVEIILGGGGARNPTLVRALRRRLPIGKLLTHDDFGIPSEAKEALAFAILAQRTISTQPGNVPSATGAARSVILGKISPV